MTYPSLKLVYWPEPDKQAWERATEKRRLFDSSGPASRWAEATKTTNIHHYGRWLAFIQKGSPEASDLSPAERLDRVKIESYATYLERKLAPVTVAGSFAGLASMMRALEPRCDWRWLQEMANVLVRNATPVRDKRSRIRPVKFLFETALIELNAAAAAGLLTRNERVRFRNALMLGLLSACPVRLKNFASIRVGTSLVNLPSGWRIQFPREMVKNRQPIDLLVPNRLAPFLDQYLDCVLPHLARDACETIWPNWFGDQMTGHAIYLRMTKYTKRVVGTAINPHLFRDCAATSMSLVSVKMALSAGDLLGHSSFGTTEKYYIHAQHLESARRINAILDA